MSFPHKLTAEERGKGGKVSKRGPSVKTQLQNILAGDIPSVVEQVLKNRKVLVGDKLVKSPIVPMDKHAARAVALVLLKNALLDEAWAVKILAEYMDGKPQSNDTLTIKAQTAAEIAETDAKAHGVLEKYNLSKRSQIVETTATAVEESGV